MQKDGQWMTFGGLSCASCSSRLGLAESAYAYRSTRRPWMCSEISRAQGLWRRLRSCQAFPSSWRCSPDPGTHHPIRSSTSSCTVDLLCCTVELLSRTVQSTAIALSFANTSYRILVASYFRGDSLSSRSGAASFAPTATPVLNGPC